MYSSLREYFAGSRVLQQDVAAALGVSPSCVSMIASGQRTPSLGLAIALSRFTGVPITMFLQGPRRRRNTQRRELDRPRAAKRRLSRRSWAADARP